MNNVKITPPHLQRTISAHQQEFHSSQVRFFMADETKTHWPLRLKDCSWLAEWQTAVCPCFTKYMLFSQPIPCPSLFVPIHQWQATLSIQIHLCPLAVAAVTSNDAVCQEARSVTLLEMGCNTKGKKKMGACVGARACVCTVRRDDWWVRLFVWLLDCAKWKSLGRKGHSCLAGWQGGQYDRILQLREDTVVWGNSAVTFGLTQ